MTINLTPEQERRLQTLMRRGAYASVEELVEAALAAVEQRTLPSFSGTPAELDALLSEGLASKELAETDFWCSVHEQADTLRAERRTGSRP
jgi:Arc/MetJ-type ribon-helix-helix transcriptional regulator